MGSTLSPSTLQVRLWRLMWKDPSSFLGLPLQVRATSAIFRLLVSQMSRRILHSNYSRG